MYLKLVTGIKYNIEHQIKLWTFFLLIRISLRLENKKITLLVLSYIKSAWLHYQKVRGFINRQQTFKCKAKHELNSKALYTQPQVHRVIKHSDPLWVTNWPQFDIMKQNFEINQIKEAFFVFYCILFISILA